MTIEEVKSIIDKTIETGGMIPELNDFDFWKSARDFCEWLISEKELETKDESVRDNVPILRHFDNTVYYTCPICQVTLIDDNIGREYCPDCKRKLNWRNIDDE